MPKENVNKNPDDPRAAKTIRDIKNTMLQLIVDEPFDKIRVEQILKKTPVQSNTFYRYFASKQDVLDAIGDDLLSGLQGDLKNVASDDLRGGVKLFYYLLNTDQTAYHKLFSDDEYHSFVEHIRDEYFDSDFFRAFCHSEDYQDMVPTYIGYASLSIYRRWKTSDNGSRRSLDQLATDTAELLMHGLNATD